MGGTGKVRVERRRVIRGGARGRVGGGRALQLE